MTQSLQNGPYEYLIYRAEGIAGTDWQLIHTLPTADLNDTVYVDTLINTLDTGWVYRVELYNDAPETGSLSETRA
ncbi:MAG: hypothetical protein R2756_05245 [Bacteroidales bacterium]